MNNYLFSEILIWLEGLGIEQRERRGKNDGYFNLFEYLNYVEAQPFETILSSDGELRRLASILYSCDVKDVYFINKPKAITRYCFEFHINIKGKSEVFYLKKAWEGAIKEAIGIEMNNLLTDTFHRYICNDEIVMTNRMFEPIFPETVHLLRRKPKYAFAYGAWEVFTTILGMTDRKIKNVRWNGEKLANIDFGLVFYRGKPALDSRLAVKKTNRQYLEGRNYALDEVITRMSRYQDKLNDLLLHMDSSFCRSLSCHSVPAVPLKIIFTALKEFRHSQGSITKEEVIKNFVGAEESRDNSWRSFLNEVGEVNGHQFSAFVGSGGNLLATNGSPDRRFRHVCSVMIQLVKEAASAVTVAGLGSCGFIQISTGKTVLFAMNAVKGRAIVLAVFNHGVEVGTAKRRLLKAVERFRHLHKKMGGCVVLENREPG